MKLLLILLPLLLLSACKNAAKTAFEELTSEDISAISAKEFTEFKVLDSKFIDTEILWAPFNKELSAFTEATYNSLKPFILEQDIPTLQQHIREGQLTYENLTKFYLYRIRKFDRANVLSLNAVISLNPYCIAEARQRDQDLKNKMRKHAIFGMPILLKDNINTLGMPTTSGAVAFQNNTTDDAFVVERLKVHGALILGKANLSEWAYFFCGDCPSGYSAIGGQTLNPYGRKTMDTGGSSSGSGVAVAANFCVAAIGTETSGSILSPASHNSIVGLKPTVGLLSRSGIVPISSTLDTPGPMTKNVIDNAIVLDAMTGYDQSDMKSIAMQGEMYDVVEDLFKENSLKDQPFGAFKRLMDDSLYVQALTDLKLKGAIIVEIEEEKIKLSNFIRLLNLDMKRDFPSYVSRYGNAELGMASIEDVILFNKKDSLERMPYGQKLFEGIMADAATDAELATIKDSLKTRGRRFFEQPMQKFQLDAMLSINNVHAGFAAVAEYPAITVPMGFSDTGEPKGLTFIARPWSEVDLFSWAYNYEQVSRQRKAPENYN